MSTEPDTSTRTIASVAAVIAITALLLGLIQSSRTGLIAEFAGTANAVSQQNETNLLGRIEMLAKRVEVVEKSVKANAAKAVKAAAKPAPAPAAADKKGGD